MNMGNGEDECLHKFGQHCQVFYDSSLILRSSNTSLSSMQEEKKADENATHDNDIKKKQAEDGKIALETLDRISAICSLVVSITSQQQGQQPQQAQTITSQLQESLASLRQEHALIVEHHNDLLLECGLSNVDQFVMEEPSCSSENSKHQKYIQMRDAMRRRAHKISMQHRQNSFFELLSEWNNTTTDDDTEPSSKSADTELPRMTQLENIQHTLSTIRKFVGKYQSNIGSHSFLAGLYRIVDLQLNPKSGGSSARGSTKNSSSKYVIRWKFRGSVLTEACRSCHGRGNENVDDELAYARDAIQVLFSFLIWVKDIDVEGGEYIIKPMEENDLGLDIDNSRLEERSSVEPILSFEIEKYISNANLRRILAVLPNPKRLDARATGSVEELDSSLSVPKIVNGANESDVISRKNIDGHRDEQWPWFTGRWESCALL
mmetsp:Transcript_9587/g.20766  ORF Transcript_9587/g.20766 Transcript_9587/m.20766 type:complete len:434 (+) Transcript_9587:570-1871(+)